MTTEEAELSILKELAKKADLELRVYGNTMYLLKFFEGEGNCVIYVALKAIEGRHNKDVWLFNTMKTILERI